MVKTLEKIWASQWEAWHPIYEMENRTCSKLPISIGNYRKIIYTFCIFMRTYDGILMILDDFWMPFLKSSHYFLASRFLSPKGWLSILAFPDPEQCPLQAYTINNVLLVKIEGPVWYTIYHHLPVVKGVSSKPSINQPTNGKRTSMYTTMSI